MAFFPYKSGLGDNEFFQETFFVQLNSSSSKSSEVTWYFERCSFHSIDGMLTFQQVYILIIFFLSRKADNYVNL